MKELDIYSTAISDMVTKHYGSAHVDDALKLWQEYFANTEEKSLKKFAVELSRRLDNEGGSGKFYLDLFKHYISLKQRGDSASNNPEGLSSNAKKFIKTLGSKPEAEKSKKLQILPTRKKKQEEEDTLPSTEASSAAKTVFQSLFFHYRVAIESQTGNKLQWSAMIDQAISRSKSFPIRTELVEKWLIHGEEIGSYPDLKSMQDFIHQLYVISCEFYHPNIVDKSFSIAAQKTNEMPESNHINANQFF